MNDDDVISARPNAPQAAQCLSKEAQVVAQARQQAARARPIDHATPDIAGEGWSRAQGSSQGRINIAMRQNGDVEARLARARDHGAVIFGVMPDDITEIGIDDDELSRHHE